MAKRKTPQAFDVKMTADERKTLASELCTEIEDAFSARAAIIQDGGVIDLVDWFYEQGRTDARDLPFPGAADLTSYFITENVDAMRSRMMKAVFGVKPFCFVEGWGASQANAGYVEAFMDWQVQESTLKEDLGKVIHGALIEDAYILEVSEKIETRRLTEKIDVALETDPITNAPLFSDGNPALKMDEDGEPVLAEEGQEAATVERTYTKTKRLGPQYDPISMKEFVFLPGHAKSTKQIWGYAYRFWDRVPQLVEKAKDGIYDKQAVADLGEESDREGTRAETQVADIAPQTGPAAEKELFQVSLKRDLDGDGREEWYLCTVSLKSRVLLRLKLDKFVMKVGRPRCVPFVLFPRRNSVYGYSYGGDKLLTLAEEHTALRNMKADRSALATNAPMMVMQGAIWDPDTQPFGVGRTIPVRNPNDVVPMQIPDVPNSVVEQEQSLINAKERVGGLSDVAAIGTRARQSNTLGQDQMISQASAVRVDEPIGHLHLAISHVMALSHAIWVETLEADSKGMDAPDNVLQGLKDRGTDLPDGKFTASQLKGDFHFEPYGTDDTADPVRRQSQFNNKFGSLAQLGQTFPGVQVVFQSTQVAKAIVEEWMRSYNVRDRQPYLGAFQQAPEMPPGAGGMMPAMGAQPPGGAPDMAALLAMAQGGGAPPAGGNGY